MGNCSRRRRRADGLIRVGLIRNKIRRKRKVNGLERWELPPSRRYKPRKDPTSGPAILVQKRLFVTNGRSGSRYISLWASNCFSVREIRLCCLLMRGFNSGWRRMGHKKRPFLMLRERRRWMVREKATRRSSVGAFEEERHRPRAEAKNSARNALKLCWRM